METKAINKAIASDCKSGDSMNSDSILSWLISREDIITERIVYELHGNAIKQVIKFSTGEVYEQTEIYRDSMHKETEIKIDGDVVFHSKWVYGDYKWVMAA